MALVYLAHFTHSSFDYLLDLDVLTFNSMLDATTRVDSARWVQLAWLNRAAQHADQSAFTKMVQETWGKSAPTAKPKKGIKDLLRDFGSGI